MHAIGFPTGVSDEVGGIAFVTPTEGDALIVEKILGNKIVKRKKKDRKLKVVLVPRPKDKLQENNRSKRKVDEESTDNHNEKVKELPEARESKEENVEGKNKEKKG